MSTFELRKTGILGESKMELRDFLAFNRLKLFLIPSSLSGNCKFRCCSKVILGTSLLLVNIKNLLKSLNVNPKLFSAVTFFIFSHPMYYFIEKSVTWEFDQNQQLAAPLNKVVDLDLWKKAKEVIFRRKLLDHIVLQ